MLCINPEITSVCVASSRGLYGSVPGTPSVICLRRARRRPILDKSRNDRKKKANKVKSVSRKTKTIRVMYREGTTGASTLYHGIFYISTSYSFATSPPFGRLRGAPPGLGASPLPPVGAPLSPGFARHAYGFGGLRSAIGSSRGGQAAMNVSLRTIYPRGSSPRILADSLRSAAHHRIGGLAEAAPPQ